MTKIKIYPNIFQRTMIDETFWCCTYVYNETLKKRRETKMSFKESKSLLPKFKETEIRLKKVDSQALQAAVRDLDFEYQKFFAGVSFYPQMIKICHSYKTYNARIENDTIRLPKIGFVRIEPGVSVGEIKTIIVQKENKNDYFIIV